MEGVTPIRIRPGATALADVQAAARAAGTPFVWLLDGGAEPREHALEALQAAGQTPAASVPVDAAGRPQDAWIGTFDDADVDVMLQAARERRVPLRFTPVYSLLAERDLIASQAPPDLLCYGPYADLEWSARLFRRRPGVLVPGSEVQVGPRRVPPAPRALARLLRSDEFRPTDGLRLLRIAAGQR